MLTRQPLEREPADGPGPPPAAGVTLRMAARESSDGSPSPLERRDLERQMSHATQAFSLEVIDRMGGLLNAVTEKADGFLHQDARRRVVRVLVRHQDLFFAEPAISLPLPSAGARGDES